MAAEVCDVIFYCAKTYGGCMLKCRQGKGMNENYYVPLAVKDLTTLLSYYSQNKILTINSDYLKKKLFLK